MVVPCEKNIGDTLTFIIALSIAPITCPLVPWLCCPLDFSESTISISPKVNCTELGANYGSTIFWTMQGFNILGLLFAVGGLARCSAEVAGYSLGPTKPIGVAYDIDLPNDVADKLNGPESVELAPINFIRNLFFNKLREDYKFNLQKDLQKQQQQQRQEEPELQQEGLLQEDQPNQQEEPKETYLAANSTFDSPFTELSSIKRTKRQSSFISVPIPTLTGFVPGNDDPIPDACDRDEVLLDDGDCYELLEQGPCEDDYFVIMDAVTKKGYCAPRLCAPGKVFVFSDQLCHDSREAGICPPGRMLFTSSFGTPLCGCPDGTYEEDDDLDDDVCEPILGQIPNCPPGEVFWFNDFRSPPVCKPDPCKGQNLNRKPEDLPFVPSLFDGKCYAVGSQPHFCRSDQYYSLSLKYLRGVCSSLDDAGYQVLDDTEIEAFRNTFGEFITRDTGSPKPISHNKFRFSSSKPSTSSSKPARRPAKITPASTTLLARPEIGSPVMKMVNASFLQTPILIGQSVVANHHPAFNEVDQGNQVLALVPTHMNAFSTPLITVRGSTTNLGFVGFIPMHHFGATSAENDSSQSSRPPRHIRKRRSPRPYASPGNVFEPGLSACRAGAVRDANAKCRDTILPSRFPPSRPVRDVSPVQPRPSCPGGGFWGLGRTCSSSGSGIASAINSLGLG